MTSLSLLLTFVCCFAIVLSKCPAGVRPVNCFVDPCTTPAPEGCSFKTCVPNYCGGCNRQFFDESGNEVCKKTPLSPTPTETKSTGCPPGVRPVNCFVDPCRTPAPAGCSFKTCVSNYCGGCNRQFFDEAGNEVCKNTPFSPTPTEPAPPKCPGGVRPVNCFVDPCRTPAPAGCSFKTCVPNYCGGCNRQFFDEAGNEVCKNTPVSPTPTEPAPPKCPGGVRPVNCFVDPCRTPAPAGCSFKTCVPNYCGGCNRQFFDEAGNEVCKNTPFSPTPTEDAETEATIEDVPTECPPGVSPVNCFIDPCSTPAPAGCSFETCVSNYCGGCNRQFFDEAGNEVCKAVKKPHSKRPHTSSAPKTLPEGSRCTTSGTLGSPPVPCNEGLICKITDPGRPELDVPNRGVCTAEEENKCGPVCMMFCPFGNELDAKGCPICKCKSAPVAPTTPEPEESECGPVCMRFCPFGNELDAKGCPICQCRTNPAPKTVAPTRAECGPSCMIFCKFGKVLDANGCPTCRCKNGFDTL